MLLHPTSSKGGDLLGDTQRERLQSCRLRFSLVVARDNASANWSGYPDTWAAAGAEAACSSGSGGGGQQLQLQLPLHAARLPFCGCGNSSLSEGNF